MMSVMQNERGELREIEPLCVLDFYVCENLQRKGYGRLLYEHMAKVCVCSVLIYGVGGEGDATSAGIR